MKRILSFFKQETVLCIAALLAIVSSFIVKPGKEYLGYIDFRTLSLLFCLMAVVSGLQNGGAFDHIAQILLKRVKNTRQLVSILVFMCFFLAMFITNDVALLTFVPFSILILTRIKHRELTIITVVMQTIAANLGSALLPIGNPQNLYLYGLSNMSFGEFVVCMLPVWGFSLVLLVISMLFIKRTPIETEKVHIPKLKNTVFYVVLFMICLATVAGIIPYYVVLAVVIIALLIKDRHNFLSVDYLLLLTFVFFFIFIGNMKNIPQVTDMMKKILEGKELLLGILFSQVISNVPAAILLSGFTEEIKALLWGTNIGGLGTLIASLASLISYKIYNKQSEKNTGKYLLVFTGLNLVYLVLIGTCAFFFMGNII